jgi:hypothetical protein
MVARLERKPLPRAFMLCIQYVHRPSPLANGRNVKGVPDDNRNHMALPVTSCHFPQGLLRVATGVHVKGDKYVSNLGLAS